MILLYDQLLQSFNLLRDLTIRDPIVCSLLADHSLPILLEYSQSNQYVQCIVHSSLYVLLIVVLAKGMITSPSYSYSLRPWNSLVATSL